MHYVHTLTIIMRNSLQKYYFYLYERMFFACFLKENYILLLRDNSQFEFGIRNFILLYLEMIIRNDAESVTSQ